MGSSCPQGAESCGTTKRPTVTGLCNAKLHGAGLSPPLKISWRFSVNVRAQGIARNTREPFDFKHALGRYTPPLFNGLACNPKGLG